MANEPGQSEAGCEKTYCLNDSGFPTRSDTNWHAQLKKLATDMVCFTQIQ